MTMLTVRYLLLSIKSRAEYRVDFLSQIGIGAAWQVSVIIFATVLIANFPGMGGWSPGDVLLITAIRMTGHALAVAFFIGMREMVSMVQDAKIDVFLLRPLPVYRQALMNHFHVPVLGDLAVAFLIFGVTFSQVTVEWSPGRIVYLVLALGGAMFLEAAVQTFLGGFALRAVSTGQWQEWAEELMSTFGSYPQHIFPGLARAIFTFLLPIAFAGYLPAAVLTGHADELPLPAWMAVAAPGINLLLFLVARRWWNWRLSRYESVGG
ncbi:ABC transporter permease [Nonomuraea sp. NPDC050153]|uniref:ABC transporter permease n=1 Tax=Nonomuraea sp. NPDC050153 TaxID=3364359 RepID=UPI0037BC5DC5